MDAVLYPTPQLLDFQAATGQKWYTLAFIVADIIKKARKACRARLGWERSGAASAGRPARRCMGGHTTKANAAHRAS